MPNPNHCSFECVIDEVIDATRFARGWGNIFSNVVFPKQWHFKRMVDGYVFNVRQHTAHRKLWHF